MIGLVVGTIPDNRRGSIESVRSITYQTECLGKMICQGHIYSALVARDAVRKRFWTEDKIALGNAALI